MKHKPECAQTTETGKTNKQENLTWWQSATRCLLKTGDPSADKRHACDPVSPERKGWIFACGAVCGCIHTCVVVTWPQRSESVWLFHFSLHETIWLSFNWLTDVDADSQRARHWPAAWEARKPSDKMLQSFWQLPPSSSLYLSLWSRTQWVFCLGQIYSRSKHHWAQPGRLIGKRLVRYEAHRERFQHLHTEWVTKSHREAHRWSRCTYVHV